LSYEFGTLNRTFTGGCRFESLPGLLRTKVYSAFYPSGVGKWVSAAAGKAKAGMAHSGCGWTCGCADKTENTCHTWGQVYAPLPLHFNSTNLNRPVEL